MFELLIIIALSIFAAVMAAAGVGMAGKKKSYDEIIAGANSLKNNIANTLKKGHELAEKGRRPIRKINDNSDLRSMRAYLQALYTFATESTGEGFKADIGNAIYKGIQTGSQGNVNWMLRQIMGDSAINAEKLFGISSNSHYLDMPDAVYKEIIRSGNNPYRVKKDYEITRAQRKAKYEILSYAHEQGLSTKDINIYFTEDLSNETDRGRKHSLGDGRNDIYIAAGLEESELLETGKHEIKHIRHEGYNEAQINKELFEERRKDDKKYGEMIAQLTYLDELSRHIDPEKKAIAEEFKKISPKGKEMLEDTKWQDEFKYYRESKKYKEKQAS